MFSKDRIEIDMGRDARVASDKLFRALAARDGGCRCCGAPVSECEAHHVVMWTDDGPTDAANLVLLCWRCHRLFHEGRWRMKLAADGTLHLINPRGEHLRPKPPPGRVERIAA